VPSERWRVGDVTITKVVENEMSVPLEFFGQLLPTSSRAEIEAMDWLQPDYVSEGMALVGYHSFLVQTPTAKIVVDTGVGNSKPRTLPHFNMLDTGFPDDVQAVWKFDDVDAVVSTHLHVDHVGWNTRLHHGGWVPTFGEATYHFVEQEYLYWERLADNKDPVEPAFDATVVFNDSIRPVVDSGQASFVGPDARLTPEVSLLPSPGHTPGHVSVVIESNDDRAVITGDLMHSPCQIGRPEWSCAYDADREAAAATRRVFLERFADSGTLVIGTHFGTPTGVRVQREGSAFRLAQIG